MNAPTISVATEHGTFLRSTWNDYTVIRVLRWPDGKTLGTTWHRSLENARKAAARSLSPTLGFYSVATGEPVAPGRAPRVAGGRAARVAPKPAVVHEYERCAECEYRHPPERLRCGNCWRCHEPSSRCKTTRKEIAASRERHADRPEFFRVLTNVWRPWDEVTVPQCDCH